MEKLKYSILVCAYCNVDQFNRFLMTACSQDFDDYEVVVVDNATPNNDIMLSCDTARSWLGIDNLTYIRLSKAAKRCKNIAQGINIAAVRARGERFVVVADSNVLLSDNLLSEIDKHNGREVVISGAGTDIKISPDGNINTEYAAGDPTMIELENARLLKTMGWPDDPLKLKLIPDTYRVPDPHNQFDVYVISLHRSQFSEYDEAFTHWGPYHAHYVKNKCMEYGHRRLKNVRIIHQYHRVWKDE
jgi:hypothetical protein